MQCSVSVSGRSVFHKVDTVTIALSFHHLGKLQDPSKAQMLSMGSRALMPHSCLLE